MFRLEHQTLERLFALADNAFPRGGGYLQGKLVRVWETNELRPNSFVSRPCWLSAIEKLIEREMQSERQSPE